MFWPLNNESYVVTMQERTQFQQFRKESAVEELDFQCWHPFSRVWNLKSDQHLPCIYEPTA